MPAEWEQHEATWLSWPKDPLTFPENIIEKVEAIYVQMIEALKAGERVEILVDDERTEDRVAGLISKKKVPLQRNKKAEVWIRD